MILLLPPYCMVAFGSDFAKVIFACFPSVASIKYQREYTTIDDLRLPLSIPRHVLESIQQYSCFQPSVITELWCSGS